MYADREEVEAKRSVKDRLNGTSVGDNRRRQVTGKRFAFSSYFPFVSPGIGFKENLLQEIVPSFFD